MLVLTFYHRDQQIDYTVFKLYNKKYSRQIHGEIKILECKSEWSVFNSQDKLLSIVEIEHINGQIDYNKLLTNTNLSNLNFDVIVHKIACGGDEFQDINLLNELVITRLEQFTMFAPQQQIKDISLARTSLKIYSQAKHYVCFDSGFHHSIDLKNRLLNLDFGLLEQGYKNYGTFGLNFEHLANKLIDITDKKNSKGKWILVYLDDDNSIICGVKNGKSKYCSASAIHSELPSLKHSGKLDPQLSNNLNRPQNETSQVLINSNLTTMINDNFTTIAELINTHHANAKLACDYYIGTICQQITRIGNVIQGIDGIIFSGTIGTANPKIRQLICQKLEWLGIAISNKANLENQTKLHKKLSSCQVFALKSHPENAMLEQLFERI